MSNVFILADFAGDKASKTTAELATVAARIGAVTAVVFGDAGKGADRNDYGHPGGLPETRFA